MDNVSFCYLSKADLIIIINASSWTQKETESVNSIWVILGSMIFCFGFLKLPSCTEI